MRLLRAVLALLLLAGIAACGSSEGSMVESYGPEPSQVGEWFLPGNDRYPVVVLIHGDCYQPSEDRHLEDPVAEKLRSAGFAVFNIDYLLPGLAAYPATFDSITLAVDHLPTSRFKDRLDLARVAFVGYSAGGHLALWAGSDYLGGPVHPSLRPALVVAQAPVADLVYAQANDICSGAVRRLLGGTSAQIPEVYGAVDPTLLTSSIPVVVLHGQDAVVPLDSTRRYMLEHPRARLVEVPGDHFAHLDPGSKAVAQLLKELDVLKR